MIMNGLLCGLFEIIQCIDNRIQKPDPANAILIQPAGGIQKHHTINMVVTEFPWRYARNKIVFIDESKCPIRYLLLKCINES